MNDIIDAFERLSSEVSEEVALFYFKAIAIYLIKNHYEDFIKND